MRALLAIAFLTVSAVAQETAPKGDWTVATLKEHFDVVAAYQDKLIAAQERAAAIALSAQKEVTTLRADMQDKAVTKNETAIEKRFEGVNEFRKTLSDQTGTFVTRGEALGFTAGAIGLLIGIAGFFRRVDGPKAAPR